MFLNKLRRSRTAVVGVSCALVGAAAVPVISLAGSISGSTGDGPMVVQSGESSVTYQAQTNVGSLPATAFKQLWQRVGDTVSMTGAIPVSPAASGTVQVYVPLPVDSNVTTRFQCLGTGGATGTTSAVPVKVLGSEVTGHAHQCVVEFTANGTGQYWVHYTANYRVVD